MGISYNRQSVFNSAHAVFIDFFASRLLTMVFTDVHCRFLIPCLIFYIFTFQLQADQLTEEQIAGKWGDPNDHYGARNYVTSGHSISGAARVHDVVIFSREPHRLLLMTLFSAKRYALFINHGFYWPAASEYLKQDHKCELFT
jgi:hypothetical protein